MNFDLNKSIDVRLCIVKIALLYIFIKLIFREAPNRCITHENISHLAISCFQVAIYYMKMVQRILSY